MPAEQVSSDLNLSLFISVAALVLSVLSPLISALVNGIFRIKEKNIDIAAKQKEQEREFYYQHRAEVTDRDQDFVTAMGEVYIYVDKSLWPLIDKIAQYVYSDNAFAAKDDFIELCKALSAEDIRTKHKDPSKHTDDFLPKDT
ncbi:hypothetical protein [uncultured Flavonifractor sp.]|uniref:hypothetical protein n=1 Tax=uncultured Flavonifractor sp. TaxID=1193534 RepID=UPI00262675E7|nr:hypothetical protein [uncultured Flavonifractor sp.]